MVVHTDRGVIDTEDMARVDLVDIRIVFRNNKDWASVMSIEGVMTLESQSAAKAAFDEIMKNTAQRDRECGDGRGP